MNDELLFKELLRDEGLKLTAYTDTVGILTIGIGHNLNVPISEAAAKQIFLDDLDRHRTDLFNALPWVSSLDDVRQRVLVNMAFNLGVPGLLKFANTLELVHTGHYAAAADAMLQSLWARQVKSRALRLAQMMRTGTT